MENAKIKYWFNKWIHGAISDGHLIILDLKNDSYNFISNQDLHAIIDYLHVDIPFKNQQNEVFLERSPAENIIYEMKIKGIITDSQRDGKALYACGVDKPVTPFEHIECDDWPKVAWHHVFLVIVSGAVAGLMLHFLSMKFILKLIESHAQINTTDESVEDIMRVARIYKRLRPLLPKSRICLYDTLSFRLFAGFYGKRPTVVIGVKGEPFQAHCWAQAGGWILNDVPQNIQQYVPIMAI